MFTGLVEENGTLAGKSARGPGARLVVHCRMGTGAPGAGEPLVLGESIAVDGVCLTVAEILRNGFEAEASAETLARTTLGGLALGTGVNLERAVAVGARMGGHIVAGHVDAVGVVVDKRPVGEAMVVGFSFPPSLAAYIAEKGSITINGISLTVNGVSMDRFDVTLVPHTRSVTGLDTLPVSARVNLEVDLLARYVARHLEVAAASSASPSSSAEADAAWMDRLSRGGFV